MTKNEFKELNKNSPLLRITYKTNYSHGEIICTDALWKYKESKIKKYFKDVIEMEVNYL